MIHLDIDTIICDSLEPLWKMPLTGKWFGAVPEKQNWYKPFGDKYYNRAWFPVSNSNLEDIIKQVKSLL